MSIQARFSEQDPRLYNINRDVAHCFGGVVREVADRLEDERWEIVTDMLKRYSITQDELGEAAKAFLLFVASSVEDPDERMYECLVRSGWYDVPDAAQMAYMAYLGTVMSGYFWTGVHEATIGGEGPAQTLQDLRARGAESAKLMSMSRRSRWFYKLKSKLSRVRRALREPRVPETQAGATRAMSPGQAQAQRFAQLQARMGASQVAIAEKQESQESS